MENFAKILFDNLGVVLTGFISLVSGYFLSMVNHYGSKKKEQLDRER